MGEKRERSVRKSEDGRGRTVSQQTRKPPQSHASQKSLCCSESNRVPDILKKERKKRRKEDIC